MRRFNLTTCMGTRPALCDHPEGFVVHHSDAVRAVRDERRQTQRAMIAALYWRAGDLRSAADDAITPTARTILLLVFEATERAARAMEAAL